MALLALESVAKRWSAALSASLSAIQLGAAPGLLPAASLSHQFGDVAAELRSNPVVAAPLATERERNPALALFSVAPSVLGAWGRLTASTTVFVPHSFNLPRCCLFCCAIVSRRLRACPRVRSGRFFELGECRRFLHLTAENAAGGGGSAGGVRTGTNPRGSREREELLEKHSLVHAILRKGLSWEAQLQVALAAACGLPSAEAQGRAVGGLLTLVPNGCVATRDDAAPPSFRPHSSHLQ